MTPTSSGSKDRLKVDDGIIYFSGDGEYRSKIGLSPRRATDVCGSYDAERGVLTIVKYSKPGPECKDYVNSMWEIQEEPFAGDTVNAYNDGPPSRVRSRWAPSTNWRPQAPRLPSSPEQRVRTSKRRTTSRATREALDRIATEVSE